MNLRYPAIPTGSGLVSIYLEMKDSASPFQPKASFAYNTSGIILSYAKKRAARVAITPVDLASITTAWTSGGVKAVDNTNMIGLVRFDLPSAMFSRNGDSFAFDDEVFFTVQATGYETVNVRIPLRSEWGLRDIRRSTLRQDS